MMHHVRPVSTPRRTSTSPVAEQHQGHPPGTRTIQSAERSVVTGSLSGDMSGYVSGTGHLPFPNDSGNERNDKSVASDDQSAEANESGGSSSSISDLPDECLTKILDLLPIKQLFTGMRTSRLWEAASRFAIQLRDSLILGNGLDELRTRWDRSHFPTDDSCSIVSWTEEKLMQQSLLKMQLKRLAISNLGKDFVRELTLKNADRLRDLCVLSLLNAKGTQFPKLLHFECDDFDDEMAIRCPNLRSLITSQWDSDCRLTTSLMPHLTKLIIRAAYRFDQVQVREFISKNSSTLKILSIDVPLSPGTTDGVLYKKLDDLTLNDMYIAMAKACPVIRKVKFNALSSIAPIEKLPIRLSSLDIRIVDAALITPLIQSVARFSNLKKLRLVGQYIRRANRVTEKMAHLFTDMHELEDVHIHWNVAAGRLTIADAEETVQRIVQNNPYLRTLFLQDIVCSDAIRTMIPEGVRTEWFSDTSVTY